MGRVGLGGGRFRGGVVRLLGVIAIAGFSLAAAPAAIGAPFMWRVASSPARHRALNMYRQQDHRGMTARTAVVGGAQAAIEQVPWQVAILAEFEYEGNKFEILCGGSIIDLSHVLTAGHCAVAPATGLPLPATSFVVVAGTPSITLEGIEDSPTVEARHVESTRIHPDFDYAAGPGTPDDVAMLKLTEPLESSSGVKSIALPSSAASPPEGSDVVLSGFGEENPSTEELNGKLYSLGMTLGFSRRCGGEADALFLCGSNTDGSGCSGDSGSGVVESSTMLVGVMAIVEAVSGKLCQPGAANG